MESIFDDYYDSEGNLHIDARKPVKKVKEVKNLVFHPSSNTFNESHKKLIIHHCNLVDE